MDELAVGLRGRPDRAARCATSRETDPETGKPVQRPAARGLPAPRRRAVRLGRTRPTRRRATATASGGSAPGWPRRPTRDAAMPGNAAGSSRWTVAGTPCEIGAVDIGTGAWTVLHQIAADALGVPAGGHRPADRRHLAADRPRVAGGSAGTSSWGTAIVRGGPGGSAPSTATLPDAGPETTRVGRGEPRDRAVRVALLRRGLRRGAGARWTGEVRVPRMLGVFSVGPGRQPADRALAVPRRHDDGALGRALRGGVRDPRFGHVVTQDLASYHVASARRRARTSRPSGSRRTTRSSPRWAHAGSARSASSGPPAAVANAAYHATGCGCATSR